MITTILLTIVFAQIGPGDFYRIKRERDREDRLAGITNEIVETNYKGHTYLLARSSIIHAEHCRCK